MAPESSGAAVVAAMTALFACVGGHSSINPLFTSNYYEHHNRTGYTDPCWVPEPFPLNDFCKMKGFCREDPNDNSTYICDCYYGYGGEDCSEDVYARMCGDVDCGNKDQGLCVLDNNDLPHCECHAEWQGLNCTEPVLDDGGMDFCNGVRCNDHGTCVYDAEGSLPHAGEYDSSKFKCECELGWTGEHCGQSTEECYPVFLLDIFTRLSDYGETKDDFKECGFAKPVLFSDADASRTSSEYYPFCICADLWREHLPADYDHYIDRCHMNNYRSISFGDESDSYCPACDDYQDAIMEDFLTAFEDICYHFVYERLTMPLYWRSIWKCKCMGALQRSTAEFIITCPFQRHAAKDDFISWDNCITDRVCHWENMYKYFEEEFQLVDLAGARACMTWLEAWMFTVPGDKRFEEMDDTMCPCLTALIAWDAADILECIPVTFHQLTVYDTYIQVCYDPEIANRDCLNSVNWSALQLAADDFFAATACYSAMELARSGLPRGDNLTKLLCLCIGTAIEMGGVSDTFLAEALECVPDWLQIDVEAECPNYSGPSLAGYDVYGGLNTTDASSSSEDESSSAYWASSDLPQPTPANLMGTLTTSEEDAEERMMIWRYVTLCQLPLIVILCFSSWYLRKQVILKKEELAATWPSIQ